MLVDDLGRPSLERSRVLSTPDLVAPDARLVTGLESIAATTPSIEFVGASTLTGTTDEQTVRGEPVVVTLPDTAGPSLAARVELIDSTALSAASAGVDAPTRRSPSRSVGDHAQCIALDGDRRRPGRRRGRADPGRSRRAARRRGAAPALQVHPHGPIRRHRGAGRQHVGRTTRRGAALLVAQAVLPRVDPTTGRSRRHRRRRPRRHPAPERRDLGRHPRAGEVERHVAHHRRGADPRRRDGSANPRPSSPGSPPSPASDRCSPVGSSSCCSPGGSPTGGAGGAPTSRAGATATRAAPSDRPLLPKGRAGRSGACGRAGSRACELARRTNRHRQLLRPSRTHRRRTRDHHHPAVDPFR